MTTEHVEVLVEEPSMEAALLILLPQIVGAISYEVHPFQCKQELLANLPARLRAYRRWLPENWSIFVIVDQDDDDCQALKQSLEEMAANSGFITRSAAAGAPYSVVNRLVIEELEAWYFGDWDAVRAAYPRVPATIPQKRGYRNPDAIPGGTWEAFERILKKFGYFKGGLRKIEAARAVARHMNPSRNTSRSFQIFRHALKEMTLP
jgi:Domain of unknown function (DUF4276)